MVLDKEPDPTFHLPMFIMEDQPKHDEQRKVVAPMFAPRHLADFEPLIRARAQEILDGLPRNETFNWVDLVSKDLTGRMLATLFGVPQEDRDKLIYWSDTVENISNPEVFETPEQGFQELWNCWQYFDEVWKERARTERTRRRSDLHAGARRVYERHAAKRVPGQHPAADRRWQRHHSQLHHRWRAGAESEPG